MAEKYGKDMLARAAQGQGLTKEIRHKKAAKGPGEKVVLWKFIRKVWPQYKFYKFHAAVIEQLQRVIDGEITRLILQVPPRHGKSMLASEFLPAAYLLAHPDRFVGLASYSGEMAEGFSAKARDNYRAAGGILNESSKAVNYWRTATGGGLWAAGVGGSCTGRTGHLLIIDDPVKDRADAESPRMMERLRDWYTSSFYTRKTTTPDGKPPAIVVIQTRWSETDMIGHLLDKENEVEEQFREGWTVVDLPALYEDEGDRPRIPESCETVSDWRTEIDEPLCPQLGMTTLELRKIREQIGSRDFASLYQQRPAPEGGNMFSPDWWSWYSKDTPLPDFQRVMLSVDCTFTDSSKSDYVVGAVVAQAGAQFYILDLVRERLDVIGTMAMIARMYKKHMLSGTVIELAASGYAVYQMMQKKVPGLIGVKPEKSKEARAAGCMPMVEAGNVYLPNQAPWLDAFINEFALFPASKNDDMVDAVTMALNYCAVRSPARLTEVTWGRGDRLLPSTHRFNVW